MATRYSPRIVTDGLILYLDAANIRSYVSGSTSWNDMSGNNYVGNIVNSSSYNSNNGGSLGYDGVASHTWLTSPSNRWAWTPTAAGSNNMTIDIWVKTSDTTGYILSKPWNGSGQYNIWVSHNCFYIAVSPQSTQKNFTSIATGQWSNITAIANAKQFGVYINGNLQGTISDHSITNTTSSIADGSIALSLMTLYPYGQGWAGNTGFSVSGSLAIVRIYNRELFPNEVKQNFNATRGRFGL